MNKLDWYLSRLKTMSAPEIIFRVRQNVQKKTEKLKASKIDHASQNYHTIFQKTLLTTYESIPYELGEEFMDYKKFNFFGLSIDLTKPIDWHMDIDSGKRFPLSYSKDIDTRSHQYGNAKVVWEFNRLQFLVPIGIKYNVTKNAKDLDVFINILDSWIKGNPYLKGVNWYSNIEVNIRLIVWYYCWQALMGTETIKENKRFSDFAINTWLPSIYEHCVYSFNNPSRYSSANNHLISEHAGLFVASSLWKFNEAQKWLSYSKEGLELEIQLQHTNNGVNKEEAAEYIQFITDFFLIPFAVGRNQGFDFSETYKLYLYKIFNYINNLLDIKGNYCKYGDEDDGKVLVTSVDPHFNNFLSILTSGAIIFNDPALKASSSKFDIKNFLLWGHTGLKMYEQVDNIKTFKKSMLLKDEGHFIFRKQEEDKEIYMHFDVAPLGFLSIAAHGHADSLAFNLTIDGFPFFIDSGTYTYYSSERWRKYFLSTIAHNTITIDNEDQAYLAGPTMWLKHYKSEVRKLNVDDINEEVTGQHNGYAKLGCQHIRNVKFNKSVEEFEIEDNVVFDKGPHEIKMPFHIHPDVLIKKETAHKWLLTNPSCDRKVTVFLDDNFDYSIFNGSEEPTLGWYSPSFLVKNPCSVLLGKSIITKSQSFKTIIRIDES